MRRYKLLCLVCRVVIVYTTLTLFSSFALAAIKLYVAIKHDVSPPLRAMVPGSPYVTAISAEETEEVEDSTPTPAAQGKTLARDPVLQHALKSLAVPSPGLNFEGVGARGRAVPDTNGAVGATQYVQWVDVDFAVYDKSSGALVYGPADASTLWTNFAPCNTTDNSDIIVQYDKAADRWVMSQHVAPRGGPYYQCVAVSTSSDATGSFNRYAFPLPNYFPDYPKVGVWPDGYYLSMNELDPSTFARLYALVCVLDRTNMLAGAAATAQCFQLPSGVLNLLPADLDGSTAPPSGSPNYYMNLGTNSLNLWKFQVDWQTPSNSSLIGPTTIPVTSFTKACGGSANCVPQAGTTQRLDGVGERLMYRLAYRHFGDGHESLVAAHSVGASGTPTGIRWYEVRNPGGTPVLFQQGTFSPDSTYRWMPSIAMDQSGDIAVGYSVSSSSMVPGISYTGRLQTDPLNTMESEATIIQGTGAQQGSNRWGDYSSMAIDPVDDCTFWYTNEYLVTSGNFNWHTRIANFQFPGCGVPSTTITVSSSKNPSTYGGAVTFTGTVSSTSGTPTGTVAFYDGSTVLGGGTLDNSGQTTFATMALAVGAHSISAVYSGNNNFASSFSQITTQLVNKASSVTKLASAPNPSMTSQVVTFTVTVSSVSGVPTGTVSFYDGSRLLGTRKLKSLGKASLLYAFRYSGTHAIAASYGGDASFSKSSSALLSQRVTK